MGEEGPEKEFQTRNRWLPLTPDQMFARSNGISIDGNENQSRGRISGELLDRFNRRSNYNIEGDNVSLAAQLNQISGSYGISGHRMGNGILTSGDSSNITMPLNHSMSNYQMGNGIFTSSSRSDLTMNLSNYQIVHGISDGGNNFDLNRPMNQISSSNHMVNRRTGNGILTSDLSSNFTKPLNQSSSSNNMSNYQMGNVIFTSGNISNLTVDLSNYQLGNGMSEGGNTINLNRPINQFSSSNNMINHWTGNMVLTSNHGSNFIRPPSQSSSSYNMSNYQMGNGNFGPYLNSQTKSYCNNIPFSSNNNPMVSNRGLMENSIQQPSFCAINMISKPDPVISLPILNLNMQPLSPPRGMNPQVDLPNAPSILNSYLEVDSSWTHGNFTSLLLGDEILDLGPNTMLYSSNSPQMLNNELHNHLQHHNLNSPPRHAGMNNTNSFPFAPITPDHTNLLEKHRQAQMLKFLVDDSSHQEHDKMSNLISSTENETIENHCSEMLQTIAGSSSNIVSTPQMENPISEERENVIDLNETPKQKTPKRRKHRPKVVIEGKPKRTPKVKSPNNGETEKTPSKKRKYVRKNKDPEAESTTPLQTDVTNTGKGPNFDSKTESCKKRLNFDFEKSEERENQHTAADVQVTQHQVLDLNLSFPVDQMVVTNSEIVNYYPLNMMTTDTSRKFKENRASRNIKRESNKKTSRANVNLETSKDMRWKSTHQMVERDVGNFKGFGGSKEENKETITSEVGDSSEETRKKQKMEMNIKNMLCGSQRGCDINGTSGENTTFTENYKQGEVIALNQEIVEERTRENVSTGYLAVSTNSNLQSLIPSKETEVSGSEGNPENYQANMQNSSIKMAENTCREVTLCTNKVPLQDRKISKTAKGRPKVFKYSKKAVDEITSRMQSLSISGEYGKDKYALVPYGGGGAVVLFEPKRRKPRPKVDLDPETDRIWKLLMGKEGAEASEGENRNKEKWWEEERRVFQGRAESFIARMHLVQGNRRFSPWKGSVVDSVIGVFLTQNVSDQLSSSAFMALAAQFPLGSETTFQSSEESGKSILTDEPEIQGLSPYGTTKCFEKNASSSGNSSASSINHINGDFQSSSGSSSEGENSFNEENPIKDIGLKSVQNDVLPLPAFKNSENKGLCFDDRSILYHKQSLELDSNSHIQGLERFSSLNNSTPSDHIIASSFSSMEKSNGPLSYFQLLMAPQITRSETDCCEISKEEYRYFFPSTSPEMTKDNGSKNSQMPNIDPFETLMKHLTVQKSSENQIPQIEPLSSNTPQVKKSQIYDTNYRGFENSSGSIKPLSARKNGSENQSHSVTKHSGQIVDSQEGTSAANNQVFLGDKYEKNNEASAKTLKTSQKNDKARDSFDWDSLRKTVLLNGGVKERNMDSSDSMDYEAMRCADVNVISNSIRIRGMNNMLSERIKDFLNRVVTDHGSIDLEWLRDVPPDKAKDYLLSIRGLGLKSVECVRLLTLHHLAFPVDTNVGRIAVRLGWVPLQPLPESLQLHLLEMYPVLETVQKYLWPRLCKLDQKTLYELHYQLITFGKVFCTKSKPNCNACPMRGECRHFASAFASARLALPAPEDKSIVGSTAPITTDRRADLAIDPMLLQLLGMNEEREREMMVRRCEPIIEEPATPEPEIAEVAETDIEDAFYEDPDEIPTIRLNVEQLAVNLRSFMEENTDFKEEDMSKALVALAPEAASIPAPKLKYVLRLRTERQVYVLTDAHPFVKGLDKREPDDPSPYLLALLGPGEEANPDQASKGSEELSNEREANSSTVRGTLLIPCRTAMRGSFPLNGTYFQVNEVFADHESSLKPIDVPREWLWSLETRTVFFGTSATSIFRGMTTKEIQNTCWRGFVCVRGFDRKTRAPRPLNRNLHLTQNKTGKKSTEA